MRAWPTLLLALAATPAAAQRAGDDTGLLLGLRAGYGVPFGDVARGAQAVRDLVPAKIPLWLDLGYRFSARVQGELFLELAPASVADAFCGPGGSCQAFDLRFGVAVHFHLAPRRVLDPWLGVGAGVEVLRADGLGPDPAVPGRFEWTWAGVELPLVEAGVDARISERLTLGPYVSASFVQFTSIAERPVGGTERTRKIEDRATHRWVQAGLKATLRL
jgi:hypothetical protein